MKCALFGFPKVGKTTVFNLLTRGEASTDKYAAAKATPNVGVAKVPDVRVDKLSALYKPKKTTYATIDYVDMAGVKAGEMAESMDLAALRNADALLHVVRAFADEEIQHAPGAVDPRRDVEAMETELQLADLIVIEKRLERLSKDLRKGLGPELVKENEALLKIKAAIEDGRPVRSLTLDPEEERLTRGFCFLSGKPLLIVVNLGEERADIAPRVVEALRLEDAAKRAMTAVVQVQGKLEMEISRLDEADRATFMADLGLAESGLDRVIRTTYELLGLMSFFTVGEDEVRAWTIRRGTPAVKAAGTIHSDIERGYIRGEVVDYEELLTRGSMNAIKDAGHLRLEGKDYIVKDGDVVHFRFNVG